MAPTTPTSRPPCTACRLPAAAEVEEVAAAELVLVDAESESDEAVMVAVTPDRPVATAVEFKRLIPVVVKPVAFPAEKKVAVVAGA